MKLKLLAVAISLLGSFAGAQSQQWSSDKGNTWQFIGCYSGHNSFSGYDGIFCDLAYTVTKSDSLNFGVQSNLIQYYTKDGRTNSGYTVSVAGNQWSSIGEVLSS